MTFLQAFQLIQQCAIALVHPPGEGYTPYPQGQVNAHVETTLTHAKEIAQSFVLK